MKVKTRIVKSLVELALFCGLSVAAQAQIGSGWIPDGETYTPQTSAGTSITAISGGFEFQIPTVTGLSRAEERGNNLPTNVTNQWQGFATLTSFPSGSNKISMHQVFGPAPSTPDLILDEATGGPTGIEIMSLEQSDAFEASIQVGVQFQLNTIYDPVGNLITIYVNGSQTGTKVPNSGVHYNKFGQYVSSSGAGPSTMDWVNIQSWAGGTAGVSSAVAAPTFNPPAGVYTSAQTVTISSATSGATIRYTTDGSTPTETIGTLYSTPVSISATTTLNAIAFKSGLTDSPVASAIYTIQSGPGWSLVGAADFNGDGSPDLIWQNTVTGQRVIWLMNGTTPTSSVTIATIPTEWDLVGAADFNGDGQPDLIWQDTVTGQRAIWLMNGTTPVSSATLLTISTDWDLVGAADFNGDGKPDLLWQNTVTGQRAIWIMNGTTPVSSATIATIPTEWSLVGTADFNGDGKPDLIWQDTVTGQRAIWLMNGITPVSSATLITISTDWDLVGAADFNGDNNPDLIWQNTVTGQRALWLMNNTNPVSSVSLGFVN